MRLDASWILPAVAIDGIVAAADVAYGGDTAFISLLIAGPLLAATRLSAKVTGAVAGYALTLALALEMSRGPVTADEVLSCVTVAIGGGFATLTAHMRTERLAALAHITEVAEVSQRVILRPIPPLLGGMNLAAHYRSATRHALIGGDFYDVVLTPYGLRLIVGDVKGKGLQATQLAAQVLGRFRDYAYTHDDLVGLAEALDTGTIGGLGIEDFVTVVLAEFDAGEVRLVNCGHHPPLRIGDRIEPLTPPDPQPPLGLQPRPVLHHVPLAADERLLFYTDGLTEARDRRGTMFSLDDRIRDALTRPSLDDALQELLTLLFGHTGGGLRDDLALIICRPADATSPGAAAERRQSAPLGGR